ncbi:hypothetical protein OAO34_04910, partial [Candidatus Poseidoniaceae archaeon]|nr:hypothetical protein [Candidatus Poseidoniaceae archaeon]
PLLHLVSAPKGAKSSQAKSRRRRSEQRRSGPRKKVEVATDDEDTEVSRTGSKNACPQCGGTMIERDGPNTNVCKICRHEWR